MKPDTLKALYVEGIRDLYSAENQILHALPNMHSAATNEELRRAFAANLDQTETHVARLEHICRRLVVSPHGKRCKGMAGLIADGTQLIRQDTGPDVLDAGPGVRNRSNPVVRLFVGTGRRTGWERSQSKRSAGCRFASAGSARRSCHRNSSQ